MRDICVVIADPQKATRTSYLTKLRPEKGIQVVAEVGTRREVVETLKLKPRILLLDWKMLAYGEASLLLLVKKYSPQTRVILLTGRADPMRVIHAFSNGARGYLKRTPVQPSLAKAVRLVDAGEVWVPRAMVPILIAVLTRMALP